MRDAMAIVEEGRQMHYPWRKIAARLRGELPGISAERIDQIRVLAGFSEDVDGSMPGDSCCAEPAFL